MPEVRARVIVGVTSEQSATPITYNPTLNVFPATPVMGGELNCSLGPPPTVMEELATVLELFACDVAVITMTTGTWIDMLKVAIPDASVCTGLVPEIVMQFLSRLTVIFSFCIGLLY